MSFLPFDSPTHKCVVFNDLVAGEGVQSNQFIIIDDDEVAIIDPGGELTFSHLFMASRQYCKRDEVSYVFASHQDPDIVSSLSKWITLTQAKIVVPDIWNRFIPHYTRPGKTLGRIIGIPDDGMLFPLGQMNISALPAHFLHAEGNFQFYDPVAKILFSGDMGANLINGDASVLNLPITTVAEFQEALPTMSGFHQRYMYSMIVTRYWATMVESLDIEWMIPQHGRPFKGKEVIRAFLQWIAHLRCGVDLLTQGHYRLPTTVFDGR